MERNTNATPQLRLPRAPQIFAALKKKGLTFCELAKKYECSEDVFLRHVRTQVGPVEFRNLLEYDKKNQSKVQKQKEDTAMEKPADYKAQLEDARQKCEAAKLKVVSQEEIVGIAEQKEKSAHESLEEAKKAFEEASKDLRKQRRALQDANTTLKKWKESVEMISSMIEENMTFLVCPGYRGELPKKGKLVSSASIEGCTQEQGGELFTEPTVSELFESGFETLTQASEAYSYAKLVIKYKLEYTGDFRILVDDDRILKILERQMPGEVESMMK